MMKRNGILVWCNQEQLLKNYPSLWTTILYFEGLSLDKGIMGALNDTNYTVKRKITVHRKFLVQPKQASKSKFLKIAKISFQMSSNIWHFCNKLQYLPLVNWGSSKPRKALSLLAVFSDSETQLLA